MDNPTSPQADRDSQEPDPTSGKSKVEPTPPEEQEDKELLTIPSAENHESLETLIQEAYEKGIIEGRNQKIEELYFPKSDDEVPHFRGCPSKFKPSGDIFSIAREA